MHETAGFSIWEYSAVIFAVVLIAKMISKATRTVDVLWLIVAGAISTNMGLLPEPAPIPEDMPEYKDMMDEERRRYIGDG